MSEEQSVSFVGFIMSLATTAAVHFGDLDDPVSGDRQTNLDAARQMIEIIAMLQEKTRGNLSADEDRLLEALLYDLRMRFVDASKDRPRIITP